MVLHRFALCAFLAVVASAHPAQAGNGDLDPTFGSGGIAAVIDSGISYRVAPRMAVQPDGRILVCSATATGFDIRDFLVFRFNADGSLDTGFGNAGRVVVDIDASADEDACAALAVQADGRILAAGWTRSPDRMAVLRLTSGGALDTTFGGGTGRVALSFGSGTTLAEAAAIAVQSDGRIVVAGSYQASSGGKVFAVARLLGDGSFDASFALTGRVSIDFDGGAAGNAVATAAAIDSSGRIVVGGYANFGGNTDFALARLLPNGQPDTGFSGDGRARLGFDLGGGNLDAASSLVLQGNRIVLAGSADQVSGSDMALARLLDDGSPDPSFGFDGRTVVPFDLVSGGSDYAESMIAQANGKLLVAGFAEAGADRHLVASIVRLREDGNLDDQFGAFGKRWFDSPGTPVFFDVALQGSRIVACGLGNSASSVTTAFVVGLENDLIFAHRFDP